MEQVTKHTVTRQSVNSLKTAPSRLIALAGCCAVAVASVALAMQDGTTRPKPPVQTPATKPATPTTPPPAAKEAAGGDEAAMMAEFMKRAAPGEEQARLAKLVGTWSSLAKLWAAPNTPPMEMAGTLTCSMVLGGRFLHGSLISDGPLGPGTFEGLVTVGFDNITKKFQSTWMDNFGTGISLSLGDRAKDGSIVWEGSFSDAMTGTVKKTREIHTFPNDNEWKIESFEVGADGKPVKTMEITYTRSQAVKALPATKPAVSNGVGSGGGTGTGK